MHRIVPKGPTVQTADDAETFICIDSGGAVFPVVGKTIEVLGGFQVQVYSLDGRPRPMMRPSAWPSVQKEQELEIESDEPSGWNPYNNPAPTAGKEKK